MREAILNKESVRDRSFAAFVQEVRDSCESYAEKKGYSSGGVDGPNPLADFKQYLGIGSAHGLGEILMKVVEQTKSPRRVNLVKIAAWAYILYRYADSDGYNPHP